MFSKETQNYSIFVISSSKRISVIKRRQTPSVPIGGIFLGSRHPVAIQSMTSTPTGEITACFEQTRDLINAGSELVRWTVNDEKAAKAVPEIIKRLRDAGIKDLVW